MNKGKFTLTFTGLAIPLGIVVFFVGVISTGFVIVSILRGC